MSVYVGLFQVNVWLINTTNTRRYLNKQKQLWTIAKLKAGNKRKSVILFLKRSKFLSNAVYVNISKNINICYPQQDWALSIKYVAINRNIKRSECKRYTASVLNVCEF